MKQNKTKLVMFDYDGVLIDSNHLPKLFYDELAEALGTKRFNTQAEMKEFLEVSVHLSLQRLGVTTEEQLAIAMKLFHKHDELWRNLELFPGVKEMLVGLKQKGYVLAVISNNSEDTIRHDLKRHDVLQYFDHIIDNKYGYKPAPDQILHCLKLTNVKPEEAVMVDDMDGGIIAAKEAKLKKAIAVSYGYQLPYRLKGADIVINHPREIIHVVE